MGGYTKQQLIGQNKHRQENTLVNREDFLGRLQNFGHFYEWEPAVVIDVIHDNDHPTVQQKKVQPSEWPKKSNGKYHELTDTDFSWVGRIKVRLVYNEEGVAQDKLNWCIPYHQNQVEQPLVNEIVMVTKIFGHYYYDSTVNIKNMPHHNGDFRWEQRYGVHATPIYRSKTNNLTTLSTIADGKGAGKTGSLGEYYKANDDIRPLKHFEGDKVYESRFGSSVRMGAYGTNTVDRNGEPATTGSIDQGYGDLYGSGGGNPQILIRNGQRNLDPNKPESVFYYRIVEDINNDGTSLHITSGRTISQLQLTCNKTFFQSSTNVEEQKNYSPTGATPYIFPQSSFNNSFDDKTYFIGNQMVINTDRIIMQSRKNEIMMFSKRRFGIITDEEFSVDAHQQTVITSNTKTVLNSPFIFLGEYNQTKEPALLGQTTIDWLYSLCEVLKAHTHWYIHTHPQPGTSGPDPTTTQKPFDSYVSMLMELQQKLPTLCSNRVFLVGGGNAPGSDGGSIRGGSTPGSLSAVPGGYYVPKQGSYKGTISPSSTLPIQLPLAETNSGVPPVNSGQSGLGSSGDSSPADSSSTTSSDSSSAQTTPASSTSSTTSSDSTTDTNPSTTPTSSTSPAPSTNSTASPSGTVKPVVQTGQTVNIVPTAYGGGEPHTDPDTAAGLSSTGTLAPGDVAVDPKVIPYGTQFTVNDPAVNAQAIASGAPTDGNGNAIFTATDTGGDVVNGAAANARGLSGTPVVDFYAGSNSTSDYNAMANAVPNSTSINIVKAAPSTTTLANN
jgi:3D (Asp-Asp-Asp) domain-containing protein